MAVFRYSSDSIDGLTRKRRRHHIAAAAIFTAMLYAVGFRLFGFRGGWLNAVLVSLLMGLSLSAGRRKGRQRTADLLMSTEFEIDDDKVSYRSNLINRIYPRSNVRQVCFSNRGIWILGRSRRENLLLPSEIEGFSTLAAALNDWLPEHVVRRTFPPSTLSTYWRVYGIWIGSAIILYLALVSQVRSIALPACLIAATGSAWYFTWCGRKITERKWKVLLPTTGYFLAAVLLSRAFTLWAAR
jgi:hypothetical protein